jgi:hypothetical protein
MPRLLIGSLAVLCGLLLAADDPEALSLDGFGVKVGVDLAQQQPIYGGTQFDTARLVLGGHVDMGSFLVRRLHFVPGVDFVRESELKILSLSGDFRYSFFEGARTVGYAGGGIGAHLHRPTASLDSNTKWSLNVPIGFQSSLSKGVRWFGELKLVIADEQIDSSLRLSVGLAFGKGL